MGGTALPYRLFKNLRLGTKSPPSQPCNNLKSQVLRQVNVCVRNEFASDQSFTLDNLACFWASVSLSHAEGHPAQQKATFWPL